MKRTLVLSLITIFALCTCLEVTNAQEEARASWQVTNFDINANLQQPERTLNSTAILTLKNVGRGSGSTLTFRINSKASIKSVNISGANASFRAVPETQGNIQRVTVTLVSPAAPNATVNATVTYTLPVESNIGSAAISAIGSQFLPASFWYPAPNTQFTVRGADTAPFRLTVNGSNIVSSGVEKSPSAYEQTLYAQPFFLVSDWDRIEGTGAAKGITALVSKGISAEERKQADALINLASSAKSYYSTLLGPSPDVPIRLVSVRRGAGFYDGGTVLLDSSAFRRSKVDSATALLIGEAVARLWLGNQTAIRGEGGGVLRDGLTRFLANLFIEKQFGKDAAQAELLRQRIAYSGVSKRDAPLARSTPLDDSYLGSVPNKGAMVWRLVDQRVGRDQFMSTLKGALQAAKDNPSGIGLAALRAALVEQGGERAKSLLDTQLDQVTDTDLMIGLPQQRGAEWTSALRNLGSTDVTVKAVGISDRGEQVMVDATVPAKGFAEAVFKTPAKIVRAEVDPEKLYPQLDYSNDVAPKQRNLTEVLAESTRLLSTSDTARAETVARELNTIAPQLQEARIILGRALLAQNKLDEAEKIFRGILDDPLPTASSLAWGNIGLGQVSMRKGQAAEAAKRFNDAVRADADYATSVTARAERIKAESAANNSSPVDDGARTFIAQLDSAITSGKKPELESRIVSGELVRFVGGIVGTQPEMWQTRVLRTEQVDANTITADVSIQAKELGQERSGTALLVLSRVSGSWKLAGIELFEVR